MDVSVQLVDNATVRVNALTEQIRAQLRVAIVRDTQQLAARVRGKLSGGVLQVRSGRLLNSIASEMRESQYAIYGIVASRGVPYAAIHEYGGQTKPHDILPRNVQALHFFASGGEVFAKVVHHPGSKIPERSYMRSSLAEMRAEIVADIQQAARPKW